MSKGSVTIATVAGPVEILDHEFKPYPSTSGVGLADVCCECGDYHDERRQKLQSLADRVSEKYVSRNDLEPTGGTPGMDVMRDPNGIPYQPFTLRRRADAPPVGDELDALATFRAAARRLKQTESDYRDAQQAYGEAVKRLSDEAVK